MPSAARDGPVGVGEYDPPDHPRAPHAVPGTIGSRRENTAMLSRRRPPAEPVRTFTNLSGFLQRAVDDGNVVIYRPDGTAAWDTGTWQ